MTVKGGGRWRVDQFQFAIGEELIDGVQPAAIACNVGLITGGIDLPCPEYEWDVFYGVGRDGRARKDMYRGPQTFTGAIPEMYVLFNTRKAFEMTLGELSRAPECIPCIGADEGTFSATTVSAATDTGSVLTSFKSCGCDSFAVFSGITVGYIGTGGAANTVNVFPTANLCACCAASGWNGPQPAACDVYEIRRICCVGTATGNKYLVGTQILPTMAWAARYRNSTAHGGCCVGGNMTVNYLGGKVNRATISAKSGEHLMLAWDEVVFRDLVHDVAIPTTSLNKQSCTVRTPTATFPTEQPMLFSQGTISLFDLCTDFARIRSFSLEINNNLETERYISTICSNGSTVITQIPFELVEGNREITLEIEAVMETREYWEHLMREGADTGTCLTSKAGFDFRLEFRNCACAAEKLVIQGPAYTAPTVVASTRAIDSDTEQSQTCNVGAVLNSAPHVISGEGENLVLVRMNINVPSLTIWWDDA